MPTMGSLFAGIGGFDLGFERAGFDVKWQVEIDPWCRKVLAKNFPNAERYEDVRTVGAHNLSRVDVITGGFPCQDISVAGRGAGIEGARSGLWSEFARIIHVLQPKFALVENTPSLLGRGMGRVVGDLAEIGYDTQWQCVPASSVGARHRRERIWIIAYPNSQGLQERQMHPGFSFEERLNVDGKNPSLDTWWPIESAVVRKLHGIPHRVDRVRGLGNSVVPQIPEMYARRIAEVLGRQ